MYKASSTQAAGSAPAPDGAAPHTEQKKDEGVIDAEYVDVDDKKVTTGRRGGALQPGWTAPALFHPVSLHT